MLITARRRDEVGIVTRGIGIVVKLLLTPRDVMRRVDPTLPRYGTDFIAVDSGDRLEQ